MLSEHLLGIGGGTQEVEGWPLSFYFYMRQGWKARGVQEFFVMEDSADHLPVSVITVATRHLLSFTSPSSGQLDKVDLFLPL